MGIEIIASVMLLLVGIAILVIIHVCIVGRAFTRNYGNISSNSVQRIMYGSSTMSQEDIKKLPCFDFKVEEQISSSPLDCAVCLESFKVGEKCRLLPNCNHSFHAHCIDSWLSKTGACPICRACVNSSTTGGREQNRHHQIEVGVGIELT